MSTNCVNCVAEVRTGPDLLCDACRCEALIRHAIRAATFEIEPTLNASDAAAMLDRAERQRALLNQLIGGVADLQRHVKVAIDEDATRIPPGVLAVIGAMYKAIQEEKGD